MSRIEENGKDNEGRPPSSSSIQIVQQRKKEERSSRKGSSENVISSPFVKRKSKESIDRSSSKKDKHRDKEKTEKERVDREHFDFFPSPFSLQPEYRNFDLLVHLDVQKGHSRTPSLSSSSQPSTNLQYQRVSVPSIENLAHLQKTLRTKFNSFLGTQTFTIEYYDRDFASFVTLTDLAELPNKAKVILRKQKSGLVIEEAVESSATLSGPPSPLLSSSFAHPTNIVGHHSINLVASYPAPNPHENPAFPSLSLPSFERQDSSLSPKRSVSPGLSICSSVSFQSAPLRPSPSLSNYFGCSSNDLVKNGSLGHFSITKGQLHSSTWSFLSVTAESLRDEYPTDFTIFLDLVSHIGSIYPDQLGRQAFTSALRDVIIQDRASLIRSRWMAMEWLTFLFRKFEDDYCVLLSTLPSIPEASKPYLSDASSTNRPRIVPFYCASIEQPQNPAVLIRLKHKPSVHSQKNFDLPDELLLYIFQLLEARDLLVCSRVCRKWRMMSNDQTLWFNLLKNRFQLDSNVTYMMLSVYRNGNWKEIFLEWTSWELLDMLFLEPDTNDNIIFEKEEEEWIVEEVEVEVLFNEDEELFSGGDEENAGIPQEDNIPSPRGLISVSSASPPSSSTWRYQNTKTKLMTRRRKRLSFIIKDVMEREDIYAAPQAEVSVADSNAVNLLGLFLDGTPQICNLSLMPPLDNLLPPLLNPLQPLYYDRIYSRKGRREEVQMSRIKCATLPKLIECLTNPFSHNLDFMKTFLVTYQYFTTPETLLKLLLRRYYLRQPADEDPEEWKRVVQVPVQLRVFNIIKTWLEYYFSDFSEKMIHSLKQFAANILVAMKSEQILRLIKQQQSNQGRMRTIIDYQFNTSAPPPEVPKNVFSRLLSFNDITHLELARQLTIIEFDFFSVIKPRELLHQAWKRVDAEVRCPNVLALLKRFKDLSTKWVPVLFRRCGNDMKKKIKTAKRMICVSQELLKLNNFNTMMAILVGLRSEIILKNSSLLDELPGRSKKLFRQLETLMTRVDLYQERLAKSVPCIPYLELHLKKIVAAEKHIPSVIGKGLANFSKSKYIYSIISQLIYCQQTPYNLEPVIQISNLLKDFKDIESELQ